MSIEIKISKRLIPYTLASKFLQKRVDSLRNDISINSKDVLKIYQNHKIDFDQLIMVLPPKEPKNDFDAKIFNNDNNA